MKLALLVLAALASPAFAQTSLDPNAAAVMPLCEDRTTVGNECYTLALNGAPVRVASLWNLSLVDVKDSRCPADVDCVWEGFVKTTFKLSPVSGTTPSEKIELSLDPRDQDSSVWVDREKGLQIELKNVTPLKIGRPPAPTRYYAQVRVTSTALVGNPPVYCPAIERPAVCSYKDIEVSGANSCLSRAELIDILNKQGISYDPADIKCKNLDL